MPSPRGRAVALACGAAILWPGLSAGGGARAAPNPASSLPASSLPASSLPAAAPGKPTLPARALAVRVSAHGGAGRVVFTLPQGMALPGKPHASLDGNRYVLDLPGAGSIAIGGVATRASSSHVQNIQGGQDRIVLTLEPGSVPQLSRNGRRVVVEVTNARAAPRRQPTAREAQDQPAQGPGSAPASRTPGPSPRNPSGRAGAGDAAPTTPAPAAASHTPAPATPPPANPASAAPASTAPAPTAPAPTAPAPTGPAPTGPAPAGASPSTPPPALPPAPPLNAAEDDPSPPPAPPPPADTGSAALRALRVAGEGDAILLPFEPHVGAAAFALAGLGHVIFDDSKAIDLAPLKADPVFGSGRIMLLPGSTHFTMAVPPGARLALHHKPDGWIVAVERGKPDQDVAQVRLNHGVLTVANAQAADSLVLVETTTGAKLLVGTVHDHAGPVLVPHVSPEFALLPSWEGVVLRAISDRLTLTPVKQGFALQTASPPALVTVMPDSGQLALENAGALTQHFNLPVLPVRDLLQRLTADVSAAAHAPKQGRFEPRLHAAQDMLALGLDREAAALLRAARNDDPSQDGRPETGALLTMANYLAGSGAAVDQDPASPDTGNPESANPDPAGPDPANPGLASQALGNSDEVALWRALLPPAPAAAAERAAVLAADWRLLTSYPQPLRHRLLPLAASILIAGNQLRAAADLLAEADDPAVAPARAKLLQAQGKTTEAIAALDRVAAGTDRKQAAAAGRAAIELRLQAGKIAPAAAAKALQKQLYAWREPGFEVDGMLRIAALLTQAGDFRGALGALREVERLFPETHDRVHAAEQATLHGLVQAGNGSALSPLDLVALVDENADLLGQGDVASSLTPVLVDKLVALDLPERADKLVGKLIGRTQDAEPRAALGARMAGLRLDQNDAAGALSALDQTAASTLPPPLDDKRAVLRARALVQLGENAPALSLLASHASPESWEMQAQIMEQAKDWRAAEGALQKLVQSRLPAAGALSGAAQDLVLRLASDAVQAGDGATLLALQSGAAQRLSPGPRAALFQALIAQPVQGVGDLPRSAREAEAARALPAAIASYATH